ncbi:HTH-type transcriptional regulator/antitoxin HigA [Dysgonomonas alginatilytica]|uniref:HTH-type transcriptional regulator/antitoxin HigA n=1 Tax=Dysgonomonas alginatilytica TaxID=1605892 RepID=A0A2V3PNW5_9BACT|nr:helix-turn-helix domain-containing protein [Dysgonomonas alginatilytica]PXV62619.1 HTH-type transcriptional regulator/antitoxin HigA [Dysgonomonas alginatilytica]
MKTITKQEYDVLLSKIEDLLEVVNNETAIDDPNLVELNLLSSLVEEYEERYYPISKPTLSDILKLRMYEMNLSQKKLAEILNISPSRISEILSGKSEPTLPVARSISQELNISASIVLGV